MIHNEDASLIAILIAILKCTNIFVYIQLILRKK